LIFDEMGHAYNYFFVHNRDPRYGLRMISYQLLYASLIIGRPAQTVWLALNSQMSRPGSQHCRSGSQLFSRAYQVPGKGTEIAREKIPPGNQAGTVHQPGHRNRDVPTFSV
jgi:hypothetical protein